MARFGLAGSHLIGAAGRLDHAVKRDELSNDIAAFEIARSSNKPRGLSERQRDRDGISSGLPRKVA